MVLGLKLTIKVLADLVAGESPCPGLQGASRERETETPVPSYKDTNLIHQGSTLMAQTTQSPHS